VGSCAAISEALDLIVLKHSSAVACTALKTVDASSNALILNSTLELRNPNLRTVGKEFLEHSMHC